MSFLKTIWSDLVEKRLWPIAVALVVALIAIPFVITNKSSGPAVPIADNGVGQTPGASPSSPGGLGPAALSAPQVKLLNSTARHHASGPRDPFDQPQIPKVVSATLPPTATVPKAPSGGGSTSSGGGSGGSTPFVPATPPASTPPSSGGGSSGSSSPATYSVTLRVGQSGDLKVHDDVPRLTPLPSTVDPFFVFMGVMADGKTAVFLLSSDAKATGDGVCKPTPTNCQTVEMKAQDVEFFDVAGADASAPPTQYEMDLTRIVKSHSSSGATAATATTASAKSGRAIVNQAEAAGTAPLADYAYVPSKGVLQRRLPTLADVLADIARTPATP